MKIILIIKEDIRLFPPVQTVMGCLRALGHEVDVIGHYSDQGQRRAFEDKGVRFFSPGHYDVAAGKLAKLRGNMRFRRNAVRITKRLTADCTDYRLWIFQGKTICLLHNLVKTHPCILHPLEFVDKKISLFYRLLSPRYDAASTYASAVRVVNCEYNRAQILKGLLNLREMPVVLPNKMLINDDALIDPPADYAAIAAEVAEKVAGKRVILYQGIFVRGERRLEEFCQAVNSLGSDYALVIMGADNQAGYKELQQKYSKTNIIFVPFVAPPYHLLVTRLAHIGILTYFPRPDSLASVINPLYCAPNKIFEYGKFGKPMIGNDIPGLHYIFREYGCGLTVDYPMTGEKISEAVETIFSHYGSFSAGSLKYYESVDIPEIINKTLTDTLK